MPDRGRDKNDLWVEMPPSGKARKLNADMPAEKADTPEINAEKKDSKKTKKDKQDKKAARAKDKTKAKDNAKAKDTAADKFDFDIAKPTDIQKRALKNKSRRKSDDGSPRKRKKLSSYLFYYIIFAVLAVTVICVLSTTVLFNIDKITVTGETRYEEKEVIYESGVQEGQNLITLDSSAVEKRLLGALPYVDEVKVHKRMPTGLEIELTPAEAAVVVNKGSSYYLVSKNGRIMDTSLKKPDSKYITVYGFDPEYAADGDFLTVTDEGNRNYLAKLLKCVKQYSGNYEDGDSSASRRYSIMFSLLEDCAAVGIADKIVSIDISNIYNITLNYDNVLTLELGEYVEAQFKLTVAKNLIDSGEFDDGRQGALKLSQVTGSSDDMQAHYIPGDYIETTSPTVGDTTPISE